MGKGKNERGQKKEAELVECELRFASFPATFHHSTHPSSPFHHPCLPETHLERIVTGRDLEIETRTDEDPLDETTGTGPGRGHLHQEEREAGRGREIVETTDGVVEGRRIKGGRGRGAGVGVGVEVEIETTRRGGSIGGGRPQGQLQNQSELNKSLFPSRSLLASRIYIREEGGAQANHFHFVVRSEDEERERRRRKKEKAKRRERDRSESDSEEESREDRKRRKREKKDKKERKKEKRVSVDYILSGVSELELDEGRS